MILLKPSGSVRHLPVSGTGSYFFDPNLDNNHKMRYIIPHICNYVPVPANQKEL